MIRWSHGPLPAQHTTNRRAETSIIWTGFEPAISATKLLQIYASGHTDIGIDQANINVQLLFPSLSQEGLFITSKNANRFMLFKEKIIVYCDNYQKHVIILRGQEAEPPNVAAGGRCVVTTGL